MSFNQYQDIKVVHFEVSSKCNALCPQCARSVFGSKVNPNLNQKDLKLNEVKKILPPQFVAQLNMLYFNGNYGDPATATDLIPIIEYLRECNPKIAISVHSNGGIRSQEWWAKLATLLRGPNMWVHFGIDGLEDTNHLYRVNVKWKKVMENVKAFVDNGGNAIWDYIVFRHNEHQVEQAREFSNKIGFKKFLVKKTGRFAVNSVGDYVVRGHPVYDSKGDFSHLLEAPTKEEYLNTALKQDEVQEVDLEGLSHAKLDTSLEKNDHLVRKVSEFFEDESIKAINNCDVDCHVKKEKSVYIDFNGKVFPCCWLAWPYYSYWKETESSQVREIVDTLGGYDLLDAQRFSIKEVSEGPFFNHVKRGFNKSNSLDRMVACSKTCGTCHNHLSEERGQNIGQN